MKKFTLQLLVFISPIVVALYGLDAFISHNLRKSNAGENSDWKVIFDGKVNADIIINGASRAWQHIDPKILTDSLQQSAYNFGIQGYDFNLQYLRYQLFLKYNRKPKLIIQSLDVLTFQKRADLYDPGQFLPYMLNDALVKKYTAGYKGYTWFDYEAPLIRYYGQAIYIHKAILLASDNASNPPDRIKGYGAYDMQYHNVFTDGTTRIKSYGIKFDQATIALFDRYLYQCKKDSIKMIFVYTPEYIAGQKFVGNRVQLFSLIHHFSEKYKVPLFDYSADTMCYNKAYFYNSEHLNKTGSQLFSKKFAADLKHNREISPHN